MLEMVKISALALRDKRGVTAVEYALVAGALVLGIATAFASLSTNLGTYLGTTLKF